MSKADRWLLPDGVEEILPRNASKFEALRRQLLDMYSTWGYDLVLPPLIEFLESLNIGAGTDLSLQTFTLTDQLSGRLMGVRADITPQVARIDAHTLDKVGPSRLCYSGTVLHSTASSLSGNRAIKQIGIELFGSNSVEADQEVIELMLASVDLAGGFSSPGEIKLDLGHVGIYRSIAKFLGLSEDLEKSLCDILQRRALPELKQFIEMHVSDAEKSKVLMELYSFCGDEAILVNAEKFFKKISDKLIADEILEAISQLKSLSEILKTKYPQVSCYFDLGELRGYHYHTGVVFAVYKEAYAEPLAKGGRYDHIGESFGRARPATGFSADLKTLLKLGGGPFEKKGVLAPSVSQLKQQGASDENIKSLEAKVEALRQQGDRVLWAFVDEEESVFAESCKQKLVLKGDVWELEAL